MTLKDELLPLIDELRAIPGELGFRPYQVWVRVTSYSGSRVGQGTATVQETRLLVGGRDPKVREIGSKDVVAGMPEALDVDFEVGPLTPDFGSGGVAFETLDPPSDGTPKTVVYVLKGPGLPEDGLLCQKIKSKSDRPLRIMIMLKSMGRKRPT